MPKLVIAALPGAAAGADLGIALAADIRVASETAFLTTSFIKVGLPGDFGVSWFLPRLVGSARARELFYTGERVNAVECLRLGLFNKVFPPDVFHERTREYVVSATVNPQLFAAE